MFGCNLAQSLDTLGNVAYSERVDKTTKERTIVINKNQLQRLTIEGGYDFEAILAQAEIEATEQTWKVWGLSDLQSDVLAWIEDSGYPYCVKGLAIYYYRSINGK